MISPEPSDSVEQEIGRLRNLLAHDSTVPLGMVSRMQAAVTRESQADAPIGWESRAVVTCLAYAALAGGAPTGAAPTGAPVVALIVLVYVWLASWPVGKAQFRSPRE